MNLSLPPGFWWLAAMVLLAMGGMLPLPRGREQLLCAGMAALAVGVLAWVVPQLAVFWLILSWLVLASGLVLVWLRILLPRRTRHLALESERQAAIGEAGQVVRTPEAGRPGRVRFEPALLGRRDWPFVCEQSVAEGDLVFVSRADDEVLTVVKLDT